MANNFVKSINVGGKETHFSFHLVWQGHTPVYWVSIDHKKPNFRITRNLNGTLACMNSDTDVVPEWLDKNAMQGLYKAIDDHSQYTHSLLP